ncbi:Conserved_hypothetical protein [Hexamita inflata]|uniref:Uncharacterized protein n=1 Tax=Hexamita inflata TaxID=28002 RepID=A0AA86TDW7_9EUKA|nr:Conserved hypothetical protein [Hexamita inflata]
MSKQVCIVASSSMQEMRQARQHLEFYCNCGVPVTLITAKSEQLPKYYYDSYKAALRHMYVKIYTFLGFIGYFFTYSFALMKLYKQKFARMHLFIAKEVQPAVCNAVLDYCQMKNIALDVHFSAIPEQNDPQFKKLMKKLVELQKIDVLTQKQSEDKNADQTNINNLKPLINLEFESEQDRLAFLKALELEDMAPNFFTIFDQSVCLYSKENVQAFHEHQLQLFNKLTFAQPENTNLGIRNLFFYVQVDREAEKQLEQQQNNEKPKTDCENDCDDCKNCNNETSAPQRKLKLVKNPNAPILVIVPFSSKPEHNDTEQINRFADEVEKHLKKTNQMMKLVFTSEPLPNEAVNKQIKQCSFYINQLMNRNGAQCISASRVQLYDYDFEVLCKSSAFALISRTCSSNIVLKMNQFKTPCLILNEIDPSDIDPQQLTNIKTNEVETYAAFFQLMLECEHKLKDNCQEGTNQWDM